MVRAGTERIHRGVAGDEVAGSRRDPPHVTEYAPVIETSWATRELVKARVPVSVTVIDAMAMIPSTTFSICWVAPLLTV